MRTVLNVQQGTAEWLSARADCDTASEAPIAFGKSRHNGRNDLLMQKHTGIVKEIDANTQRLFDKGHASEAAARPIAEEIIGEELSPTTITLDVDGLKLLASLDGITFDDEVIFEHKLYSESLAADVRNETLSEHYTLQMDQQLLVSGAKKCLFMTSDGTKEKCAWMWYESSQEKFDALIAGWKQFAKDLADYVPETHVEKPAAEVVIDLPALVIHAKGEIVSSNMKEWGLALAERLEYVRGIKLVTDQDFSNADASAKSFRETIVKLNLTKAQMLEQTVTVGEAARMIDSWCEDLRITALKLEKDSKLEKEAKQLAIISAARLAFTEHIAALEAETKPIRLTVSLPDFAGAMKGKRLVSAWNDAVDTALANSKSAADTEALDIRAKLTWCKDNAAGMSMLFPDLPQIITKPMSDFTLLITSRIESHKDAEAEKAAIAIARIQAEADAKAAEQIKAAQEAADKKIADAKTEADRVEADRQRAELAKQQSEFIEKASEPEPVAQLAANDQMPIVKQAAVVEHQDVIAAFLKFRQFKDETKVRAILVEFIKFQAEFCMRKSA